MIIKINKSVAKGRMKAPPSKSVAHRYLICGALSNKSVVKNIDYSKDIDATLKCLEKLGAFISYDKSTVNIGGIDFKNKSQVDELDCNESGSTLRFLIPVLSRSFASSEAINSFPFVAAIFNESICSSKPGFIIPPSRRDIGGSSTIALFKSE